MLFCPACNSKRWAEPKRKEASREAAIARRLVLSGKYFRPIRSATKAFRAWLVGISQETEG